jgi:hypothetical protein
MPRACADGDRRGRRLAEAPQQLEQVADLGRPAGERLLGPADGRQQAFVVVGLEHVVDGAELESAHRVAVIGGDEHHPRAALDRQLVEHLEAVEAGMRTSRKTICGLSRSIASSASGPFEHSPTISRSGSSSSAPRKPPASERLVVGDQHAHGARSLRHATSSTACRVRRQADAHGEALARRGLDRKRLLVAVEVLEARPHVRDADSEPHAVEIGARAVVAHFDAQPLIDDGRGNEQDAPARANVSRHDVRNFRPTVAASGPERRRNSRPE